jgi:hypothetical protein
MDCLDGDIDVLMHKCRAASPILVLDCRSHVGNEIRGTSKERLRRETRHPVKDVKARDPEVYIIIYYTYIDPDYLDMGTGVKSDTARALLDRVPGPGAPASEIQVCDWSVLRGLLQKVRRALVLWLAPEIAERGPLTFLDPEHSLYIQYRA